MTPWTVAYQAPLSMGFSRQEYWSGVPFPSPGDLPDSGIKPGSPVLQTDAVPSEPPGKPKGDAVATWAGNQTRASRVAGENSTPEPPMHQDSHIIIIIVKII